MTAKPYLLAVDDEPINRFVLEDLLEELYDLTLLESGQACLDAVGLRKPDLILLDITMPHMDGYEVCRQLKSRIETRDIPIIFLTAKVEAADEKKGFDLGAVDFITKPFTESLLLARIGTHLSLSESQRKLAEQNSELKRERTYIEDIILKMRDDAKFVHDSLNFVMTPLNRTNGDLVLSSKTPSGKQYLLIGDFTGHGLPAALSAPLVSALFYMLTEQERSLQEILLKLNYELCHKMSAEMFMAALLVEWQVDQKQITVWNYGMPDLLHYRGHQLVQQVPSSSFALGIQKDLSAVSSAILQVEEGDHLFAYSDGVVESRSVEGELFGSQRLQNLLAECLQQQRQLASIQQAVNDFAGDSGLTDDITLVHLQV
ncbi:MAG: fused response regulator/phosphatase [Thiomicrorhabdus chilensis]|uniref:PP2C family protein-serine/threonine phosphatase n=1 Tax=Thiomicrorhabdus chilensis TaxID=63656 RepID=UPI00299F1F9E|nr:fused response regulator/phosphatase [Thiomicrorhabdus chilensis]MDX1348299.1 fused response regulator/phosphatase [Thiomicrorhabdus chilensis]